MKKFTEERELTVMLIVDVSASGNFGSTSQSKRELAAEVACLLAFSAIRNNDKVGLLLFSDRLELFIPPKKGRSHTLRIIREILFFDPMGRGTNPAAALDHLNKIVTRRAVVFLISDFQAEDFSRELAVTARRHDLIAIRIQDERESIFPPIGIITLEDAETGDQIEINAADSQVRHSLHNWPKHSWRKRCGYCGGTGSIGSNCARGTNICPRYARFSNNGSVV